MLWQKLSKNFLIIAVIFFILAAVYSLIVYSGVYNVSALKSHTFFIEYTIENIVDNSIKFHSRKLHSKYRELASVSTGAYHYDSMCVVCHGAPGKSMSTFLKGMYPIPPNLIVSAQEFKLEELYWIVKNGLKFTGMPAFGLSHNEQELWAIAKFVEKLPQLSTEDYQSLVQQGLEQSNQKHGHQHE